MPRRLLIPHNTQEERTGCLAACAQMALLHLGIRRSQGELNRLLGLTQAGIPASRVQLLSQLGVNVVYGIGDEHLLRSAVDRSLPPIVFVATNDLPYWNVDLRHAVIVAGYDDTKVYLNDPAFADSPKETSWGDFLLAWSEFDYYYAVISSTSPS